MHPRALALYREFEAMLGRRAVATDRTDERISACSRKILPDQDQARKGTLPMTGLSHQNTTFDELAVGQTASIERSVTANDLYLFAHASGNTNPMHMPGTDVDNDGSVDTVAPSLWLGSLISSVLGTILPGAGTLYHGQTFRFVGRARLGDRLVVSVRCLEKREKPRALFETRVERADGTRSARRRRRG